MNNIIQHKGYVGSVEFSEADGIFYGKVMGIHSLISYEGESVKELLDDFHGAVDDYLENFDIPLPLGMGSVNYCRKNFIR